MNFGLSRGSWILDRLLDLRGTLRAIARQWLLLLVLSVWGLASGVGFTLAMEPAFVASSRVLLPPSAVDAEGHKLRDIETELYIARSPEILERAGRAVTPPVAVEALRRRVRVEELTDDILEIRAEAASSDAATRLANAIADEYVAYSKGAPSDQAGAAVTILQERATGLEERIRRLEVEIAGNKTRLAGQDQLSPEALRLAALTDSLRAEQVDLARELSGLNARIADARLEAAMAGQGTRVLEAAKEPDRPTRPRPFRDAAVGGLAGLLAGAMLALVREQHDRRLRSRDEIAEAVGSPVLASVGVPRCRGVGDCRALLERWVPTAVESLSLRQAFTRLDVSEGKSRANLAVVTLAGDQAGPLVAFKLAAFAAGTGTPTAFIIATEDASAAQLRAACNAGVRGDVAGREDLRVCGNVSDVEAHLDHAELTVTVVVVAGAGDDPIIPSWGRHTLTAIAVSSGFATAESLAAAALACLDAGYPVAGTLIANPDPSDPTTGRLGEPQRTPRDRGGERAEARGRSANGGAARTVPLGADTSDRNESDPTDPIVMPRTREVIHELLERLPPQSAYSEPKLRTWRSPPSSPTDSES